MGHRRGVEHITIGGAFPSSDGRPRRSVAASDQPQKLAMHGKRHGSGGSKAVSAFGHPSGQCSSEAVTPASP